MAYGELKVDSITFTNGGTDTTVSVSGLVQSPTFSGDITVTGTISGDVVRGGTLVSGATVTGDAGQFTTLTGNTAGFTTVTGTTVTGTTGNFVSGVFTTQVSGATVTGNTGQFTALTGGTAGFTTVTGTTVTGTTANFVTVSGTTVTGNAGNFTTATVTSGVFASGTAGAPSVSVGTTDNGLYSPGTDQLALSTNGTGRLFVSDDGKIGIGAANPSDYAIQADDLVIAPSTSTAGISLVATTANYLYFSDLDAEGRGIISYIHGDDSFRFNTNGTEAACINSDGKVGIGTSSPGSFNASANNLVVGTGSGNEGITIYGGSDSQSRIDFKDSADTTETGILYYAHSSDAMIVHTAGTERARIDSSGRLLVGTSSARSGAGINCSLQVEGTAAKNSSLSLIRNSDNNSPPYLILGKSRGTSLNSNTVVQSGDILGSIEFAAADGNDITSTSALIKCEIDGTPGSNDTPGRLVFSTTADGAFSPTERMRIASGGKLTVPGVYSFTTTGGSAVYVESDGDLLRYTSSLKYKTDVETLEDARADAILNCRPVWYRSKCKNDIKTEGSEKSDWGWYGFIAEEVAEIEPRLVNWATKDAVTQEDGSVKSVERNPADYEAEGVRYDNFVPLLLNLIKRQKEQIEAMEARLSALEAS